MTTIIQSVKAQYFCRLNEEIATDMQYVEYIRFKNNYTNSPLTISMIHFPQSIEMKCNSVYLGYLPIENVLRFYGIFQRN